jgi:hypothetical protein
MWKNVLIAMLTVALLITLTVLIRVMLERGPAFGGNWGPLRDPAAANEAQAVYRMWAQSWVLGEIRALVPELRRPITSQAVA